MKATFKKQFSQQAFDTYDAPAREAIIAFSRLYFEHPLIEAANKYDADLYCPVTGVYYEVETRPSVPSLNYGKWNFKDLHVDIRKLKYECNFDLFVLSENLKYALYVPSEVIFKYATNIKRTQNKLTGGLFEDFVSVPSFEIRIVNLETCESRFLGDR